MPKHKNNKNKNNRNKNKRSTKRRAPLSQASVIRSSEAKFSGGSYKGRHALRITNREKLGSILNASTGFYEYIVPVNPGSAGMLAWGSGMAVSFEKWIGDFRIEVVPVVPATTKGSTAVCHVENVSASNPDNLAQMLEYESSATSSAWNRYSITLPKMEDDLFVLNGSVPNGQDPKTYHFGKVIMAAIDVPTSGEGSVGVDETIANVYVHYSVYLISPSGQEQVSSTVGAVTFDGPWSTNTMFNQLQPNLKGPSPVVLSDDVIHAGTTGVYQIDLDFAGNKHGSTTPITFVEGSGPSFETKTLYTNDAASSTEDEDTYQVTAICSMEQGGSTSVEAGNWFSDLAELALSVGRYAADIFDLALPLISFLASGLNAVKQHGNKPLIYYSYNKIKVSKNFIERHLKLGFKVISNEDAIILYNKWRSDRRKQHQQPLLTNETTQILKENTNLIALASSSTGSVERSNKRKYCGP